MTFSKKLAGFCLLTFSSALCFGQTITVGSITTQLNTSQRAAVENGPWPDGVMGATQCGTGTNHVFAPTADPGTVEITLPALNNWSSGLSVVGVSSQLQYGGSNSFDQSYIGGGAVYYDTATGILIHLYHAEQWFGTNGSTFYSSHGLAYSTNCGVTWHKLGEVVSPQAAWVNGGTNCTAEIGTGTLTVVGSYLYDYITDMPSGCSSGIYLSVARASISSVIAAAQAGTPFTSGAGTLFMKYTGSGTWNGNGVTDLANPQNGGGVSTQIGPASLLGGAILEPTVRYNSFENKYLLCFSDDFNAEECSWSSDALTSWSTAQAVVTGGSSPNNQIVYPTLFNTGGGDPQTLGQTFSLFYVYPFGNWSNSSLYSVTLSVGGGPQPPVLQPPVLQ